MNIAIILEATLGGTRKHVMDLLSRLPNKDYRVTFIFSSKRADKKFFNEVKIIKELGIDCIELPMTKNFYSPLNIYCILKLIAIFRQKKVEVLHLHGAIAGTLGRIAAFFTRSIRKIIYSPHGGVMHKIDKTILSKIYVLIEKLLINNKVFFIAVSSDEKEKLNTYLNIPSSRIYLIPNGIHLENYDIRHESNEQEVEIEKRRLGLKEDDFVLLYPALFLEAKGHLNFFNTFLNSNLSLHPKVKILLAGDGPLQSKVKDLVEKLPINGQVTFLGFVNNINLYFQISNAVILPSINEAFGYVLLEAIAHRKIIFATRVGGIKDVVVENENGFLYELNDLTTMIADINHFKANKKNIAQYEENATRILSEKFDILKTSEKIKQLYIC